MILRRRAVAPVIATLLMVAVAVAMSVIIFMWSQGFLSNASSAVGGQQGVQNQAVQSSISIEGVTASGTSLDVMVRNVGSVSVSLGSYVVVGLSSNVGFRIAALGQVSVLTQSPVFCATNLGKGSACRLTVAGLVGLTAGDVVTVKVTSVVGTFAQMGLTVP